MKPYKTPVHYLKFVKEEIDHLLSSGIVVPSNSEWGSPIVVVPKKNGKLRMCVDYCALNAVTKADAFPMPIIDNIFASFAGSAWFSNIDLFSGYLQLGLHPDSQDYSTFVTKFGSFKFTRLPFGLSNAPKTFQRCMEFIFKDLLHTCISVYLDDLTVYSASFEDHCKDVALVLSRIQQYNLGVNFEKKLFFIKKNSPSWPCYLK